MRKRILNIEVGTSWSPLIIILKAISCYIAEIQRLSEINAKNADMNRISNNLFYSMTPSFFLFAAWILKADWCCIYSVTVKVL